MDPKPPSAWQLEASVAAFQRLQDKVLADPSLVSDEDTYGRLTLPDGATVAHPRMLLQRLIDCVIEADHRIEHADNLVKRYRALRDRHSERSDAMRATITELLAILDERAAEGDLGTVAMRKRQPSVLITDIDLVPDDLKDTVTTVTAKKNPIGAKLKAGEEVPGAELSNPAMSLSVMPY